MDCHSQKARKKKSQKSAHFLSRLFLVSTAFAIGLPKLSEVRMHAGLMTLAVLCRLLVILHFPKLLNTLYTDV